MKHVTRLFLVLFSYDLFFFTCRCQDVSPRISSNNYLVNITTRSADDPFGLFSLSLLPPASNGQVSEPGSVDILISRTGGSFGAASIEVRSVGGGESWDSDFGLTSGGGNDTIGEILSSRDITKQAIVGIDYTQLDQVLNFTDGEMAQKVTLYVLNNTQPEDDEFIYIYLKPLTQGIAVAQPSINSGFKGYAVVMIVKHGLFNGLIGFDSTNSTAVIVDSSSGQPALLTIERTNFSSGVIIVYWTALASLNSSPRWPPLDLASLLVASTGSVACQSGTTYCSFDVFLTPTTAPRNATWFLVELYLDPTVTSASIDPTRRICNVTVLLNNYPNGLVQFAQSSRFVIINRNDTGVQLIVERLGYLGMVVMVTYSSQQLSSAVTMAGVQASPALEGADYYRSVGTITFGFGMNSQTISVGIDPSKASSLPYPKTFNVQLISVTANVPMGVQMSEVIIVNATDEPFWQIWAETQMFIPLSNNTIQTIMQSTNNLLSANLTASQLTVVQNVLNTMLSSKESSPLTSGANFALWSVLCNLMQPGKPDATRGAWQLSTLMERYAYASVDHTQCDISTNSPSCPNVNFQVYRKYPDNIDGFSWVDDAQNTLIIPSNLLPIQTEGRSSSNPTCFTLAMIAYTTEQWFTTSAINQLLNSRVISASIQYESSNSLTQPVQFLINTPGNVIASPLSACVYFDETSAQWMAGSQTTGLCTVTNNLILGVDEYVDCSCYHMTAYAVQLNGATNAAPYPIWFHISCFICMGFLVLVLITYHLCSTPHMFPVTLLMHLVVAIIATEICYVVDGFLSSEGFFNIGPNEDNSQCITMALFLHYFYISQFFWLAVEAVDLYRVLLLNDERTSRFYMTYFLVGWGIPFVFIGLFYLIVYLIYRFATNFRVDRIYGEVLSNSNFCFITNGYVALGGILLPCAVCLLIVGAIVIQAFALLHQWRDYDDIYTGQRNAREVTMMVVFWSILILTCLWLGLYVGLGQLWAVVLFVIFNITLGIYGLVAYALLRWRWCCEFPKMKNRSESQQTMYRHGTLQLANDSQSPKIVETTPVKRHRTPTPTQFDTYVKADRVPSLRVRRSAPSPTNHVVTSPYYDKRPPAHGVNIIEDFDDIIYALKTKDRQPIRGERPPSNVAWKKATSDEASSNGNNASDRYYEKKRINIADTHI